jgi:release factor glutamine methyltransferase
MSFLDYVAAVRNSVLPGDFDVVVSNPPYIPSDQMPGLQHEVGNYEDERALHGGNDGLDMVKQLLQHCPALFRADNEIEAQAQAQAPVCGGGSRLPRELWLEVSEEHPAAVCKLLGPDGAAESILKSKYARVEGLDDLAGKPRFVRLTLSPDTTHAPSLS